MDVSSQDPSLLVMDLSKGFSVPPLTTRHAEAKKPEWYHRRPPSTEISSSFRSRASSSYTSPGPPVHCRDMDQSPESLGNYMNPTLAPRLDLYRDHGNLWHPGFYGPDQSGGPGPESSGGEESDSGSDVIFLVSSSKEPILCSPFIQDGVRHIVEPLSPAVSSLDEGRGCYHLPQPLSSPSPDSSYSEDSSDSSVDIPVHHTRPVVLLSDLSAAYRNTAESVDASSDDSDVIEVSVSEEKKTFPCKKRATPQSEEGKAPHREVRRSSRIRKSVSEVPASSCSASRLRLRRRAKNDAVGIYNESCDSDDAMEYAARLSSSDQSLSQPNQSQRLSSNSDESGVDTQTDRKSPQTETLPHSRVSKSISRKRKKPLAVCTIKTLRQTVQKPNSRIKSDLQNKVSENKKQTVVRQRKKRRSKAGPPARFPPTEPEIKLRCVNVREEKKKRKERKSGSFCPFVHVEQTRCIVVNYQEEEEEAMRSSRGGSQQTRTGSLSGFVPNSSCFQPGRSGSQSQAQTSLHCCLCGQTANAMSLGDLHGPYYPVGPSVEYQGQEYDKNQGQIQNQDQSQSCRTEQTDGSHGLTDSHCFADEAPPPQVSSYLEECWIHEDCGIWSAGVFLVRGKLYGLQEAAWLARQTVCSACRHTGAIMGCFQKGCHTNYHYRCALHSGCLLNEENFSVRCPEHKNKTFPRGTRRHRR
uniref:transcription factor 20-like n=1 Tax=Semicossyphus pulcher TaxID=241346 RepID=UPI0037E7AB3B